MAHDGASLLSKIGTDCAEWVRTSNAERVRRLLAETGRAQSAVPWTAADQRHLQSMVSAIDVYCRAHPHLLPAGATVMDPFDDPKGGGGGGGKGGGGGGRIGGGGIRVGGGGFHGGVGSFPVGGFHGGFPANRGFFGFPRFGFPFTVPGVGFPFTASFWFNQLGYPFQTWCLLDGYTKYNAIGNAMMAVGLPFDPGMVMEIMNSLDARCTGLATTSNFLSPYAYPYSPYGFGYQLPFAFPFAVRSTSFGFPASFGFRGGVSPAPHPAKQAYAPSSTLTASKQSPMLPAQTTGTHQLSGIVPPWWVEGSWMQRFLHDVGLNCARIQSMLLDPSQSGVLRNLVLGWSRRQGGSPTPIAVGQAIDELMRFCGIGTQALLPAKQAAIQPAG